MSLHITLRRQWLNTIT